MVLDDRLYRDMQRSVKEASAPDPYYAEEPDWLIYMDRDKQPWLNKDKGVFTETDKKALNKAPSVFEAATIVDTRNG